MINEINDAILNSRAEYICLMDSRCKMQSEDWLERLLETFSDRTAQVGPQIRLRGDRTYLRGLLLSGEETPRCNSDNAVCWLRDPDWLVVDALPWVCVLFRRSVFLELGFFRDSLGGAPMCVDLDFCRRLLSYGWHSICNRRVTAEHPEPISAGEMAALAISQDLETSEDWR